MDRDYDGKLSFEEFMEEETPLERLFRAMDGDGDGIITKSVRQTMHCCSIRQVNLILNGRMPSINIGCGWL